MAKEKKAAENGINPVKLAVRIVLYGVLVILLGLAGYEFTVKKQAERTGATYYGLYKPAETDPDFQLKFADLPPTQGKPRYVEEPGTGKNVTHRYTWSGPFRKYELKLETTEEPGETLKDGLVRVVINVSGVGVKD